MQTTFRLSCGALITLLLLCGCKDITHVQTGYVSDRDDCRSRAESRLSLYNQPDTYPISSKEKNNALLALFDECMREDGWNVGKKETAHAVPPPVPVPVPVQQQQPTVIVVQSPAPAAAAAPIIVPAAAPIVLPPTAPMPAAAPAACVTGDPLQPVKGKRTRHHGKGAMPTCQAPADAATSELDKVIDKP